MFVLIAGGGRTGTQLANLLLEQNHRVRLVEHRGDILERIHRELPTEVIYEGIATDIDVLERASIRDADVVAACMASDEDNLVVCYLARKHFNAPRTIARINNPRNAWIFNETFCVDVALNQSSVMASFIEQEMARSETMTLLKLRRGDYSLVEEVIPDGAHAVGVALKDLGLHDNCVIAVIIRDGKILTPKGMTVFQVGDEVLAIADRPGADQLRMLLSPH